MYERQKWGSLILVLKNFLITGIIFALVVVLVFVIQGWVINSKGETIQTGLVQFASNVSGATVEVDEKTLSDKTNTKSQVIPGVHEFKIWREGYETWYRKTSVKSGRILWLNYARLIPKAKKVQSFFEIENIKAVKYSSDNKKALVVSEDSFGVARFWIIELTESPKITEINLPEKLFERELKDGEKYLSKIADNLAIDSLNENATRALLKWKDGEAEDWILIDLNDASKSINLNDNFSSKFSKIKAQNKDYSKFYALSGGELRELDFEGMTISANLLSGIVDFENYNENSLVFVRQEKIDQFSVGVFEKGKSAELLTKELSAQPKIAMGRYYGENYVHISNNQKLQIYKGSEWLGKNRPKLLKEIKIGFEPIGMTLNQEGRIINVFSDDKTIIYDLETKDRYEINSGNLSWLDNFVLYDFNEGKITVRDFDGSNVHEILETSSSFGAMLSKDEKFIYAFKKKTDGKFELVRLKMIL